MALVEQAAAAAAAARTRPKAAILVFDGVEIIDFTGPYEVFGAADFEAYTVAETSHTVTSAMGLVVAPKYTFSNAPQPDVLVVPGGGVQGARSSAATLKWITDTTARAKHTMSVCNGAFILASAGLLDGLTATTTSGRIDQLRAQYPKTKVVEDRRFVDNGKIITTAGLSSGIDGALHVVARMMGEGSAQEVALSEEYDWRPNSGFARAALADRNIPDVDLNAIGKWHVVRTQGDSGRWETVVRGTSDLDAAGISEKLGQMVSGKWTRTGRPAFAAGSVQSRFAFRGRDGRNWTATLTVEPMPSAPREYTATLILAHAS
jgi:putative intracellular protease/amidase